jgi:hypothetical protein
MEVIAERKKGIWLIDFFVLLIGLVALMGGEAILADTNSIFSDLPLLYSVIAIISTVRLIQYARTPNEPIVYDKNESAIYINGINKIYLDEIEDVSYRRRNFSRRLQFKFGRIKIKTKRVRYTIKFVAECEAVCKRLTHLKYIGKNPNMQYYSE